MGGVYSRLLAQIDNESIFPLHIIIMIKSCITYFLGSSLFSFFVKFCSVCFIGTIVFRKIKAGLQNTIIISKDN